MSVNIIDLVKNYLSPSVVSQAATHLGESEAGVSKAISAFLPILVGSVADKATSPGLLGQLKGLASGGILSNLTSSITGNDSVVSGITSSLFGNKISGIASSISNFAGIKESSAHSLLGLTSAATLGTIGKYATENNLNESEFSNLLSTQKNWVSNLLPAGLSLGALGLGGIFSGLGDKAESVKETVTDKIEDLKHAFSSSEGKTNKPGTSYTPPNPKNTGSSVWKWLLPLILLGLVVWFIWKQCTPPNKGEIDQAITNSVNKVADKIDSATAVIKETTSIDLNGIQLKGYKGGMEEKMVEFLKSGKYATTDNEALKSTWYSFDHISFVIGKADQLEAGSEEQIQNIATILKAYPDVKIKIGGYTDKTGNEENNLRLSQARADFIKAELTKLGVGDQIVGAEGYGSKFATTDASASNEERAVDRVMKIRFAK
ncbi:OmpA family protein [Elizabethkingia argentiflava]|uniref:OmpA family protein n=1 Tax=Elizabethkingia argenteiflava TaxID=2681556 RepID=A0A845PZI3_9FLAO|nr:OmpA family protein [Elizabethkingia argenteiflava]NAW51847.1 OmpA family protein [Elizabethkingia argenteiflava]